MDLILTGRSVDATETFSIGFANRIVSHGTSRQEVEALSQAFPKNVCFNDNWSFSETEAIKREFSRSKHIAQHNILGNIKNFTGKTYNKNI